MAVIVNTLKSEIDAKLSCGCLTCLSCCQLQNAQTILNDCVVYSVPNLSSLPNSLENLGRLVYVNDINEYRYSVGDAWLSDMSSCLQVYANNIISWGCNTCGELGLGSTIICYCSPVQEITRSSNWCSITGSYMRHAIKTDGTLWGWGRNYCGAVGNNKSGTVEHSPVQEASSSTNWSVLGVGQDLSNRIAIKSDNTLWGWGFNSCGQLGDGTITSRCSPVQERCSATNWCVASNGMRHSGAIKTDGSLWAWGSGSFGAIGTGAVFTNICSPVRERTSSTTWCTLSFGGNQQGGLSMAIKTDGTLWGWGMNYCGELGTGISYISGRGTSSPVRERCSATNWCRVSTGARNVAALKTDGSMWVWGYCCPISDGFTLRRCSPVREFWSATNWCDVCISLRNGIAIKTDGTLWSWGANANPFCVTSSSCSPVQECTFSKNWSKVAVSWSNSAAIVNCSKGFCI